MVFPNSDGIDQRGGYSTIGKQKQREHGRLIGKSEIALEAAVILGG
jgi:hypothetical protein